MNHSGVEDSCCHCLMNSLLCYICFSLLIWCWLPTVDGLCRTSWQCVRSVWQNMSCLSPVTKNWWTGWSPVVSNLLTVTIQRTSLTTGSVSVALFNSIALALLLNHYTKCLWFTGDIWHYMNLFLLVNWLINSLIDWYFLFFALVSVITAYHSS